MSDIPPPMSPVSPDLAEPMQDPMTLLRQQEEERRQQQFMQSFAQAVTGDPALKLRASAYARELGKDPSAIESDIEFAEKFLQRQRMATSQLQRTNPRLFELVSEPDTLAKTYDDIEQLKKVDSTWGSISRQLGAGHDMNTMSYYGVLRILSSDGNLSPEEQQSFNRLQMNVAVAQTSDSFAASAGRLLGQMWPSVALGAGTALTAVPTGGASLAAGAAIGSVLNGLLMAGETYNQARSEGLSHAEAVAAATTTGAITGYLGGKVFKSFVEPYLPTMGQLFGRGAASSVVSGAVSRATANEIWKNLLRQSTKGYAVENVQELAETVTQWTAIQTFKEGGFSAEERAKLFEELKAVAAETSKGMALIAPVGPLANALVQSRYVTQARSVKASFDRLAERNAQSKTTARDPNTSASINDTLAQEVGVEIDPKAFEEAILAAENKQLEKLAADQKITVEQLRAGMATPNPVMADLATKIPNLMDRLQKARDEGVDLRLSAGEWGTHLLGSEVGKDLSFHARMEGQTLSLHEALIVDKLSQQYIDEGKDLLKKTHLDNMEIVRQARQVKAAFKQQIMDAGRSQAEAEANAELIKVFTVAAGLRVGKKPVEFMRSPEFALAVESAGLGRMTPREPVAEPGQAPFSPVQPAGRPPADLTQPLSTIDSEAFGGQPGVAIAPKDLLDATKVEEVLGKVKERLTRTVNEAKKDEMGISAADLSGQAEPLLADVEKLSARLLELQGKTPGQKAIMQTAEPYVAEGTQASADIQALEKKLEDMIANPPPKPEAEATVFPNGRDNATAKEQKAYDRTVKAYQKHQDQIKSMRGKLAAAKATVSAAEANVQDVAQKVEAIAPVPFGGRDIAAEIVQAKQQLAQMKKTGSPEADIKAQADWIKQAEQYERQSIARKLPVSGGEMLDQQQDLDPEDQLERDDLQKLEQILFHGTPWIWEPEPGYPFGRPRLDKLGTGEGALAYGWGFYTTAVETVGQHYRAQEYRIVDRVTFDGKPVRKMFDDVTEGDIAMAFDQGFQEIEQIKKAHPRTVIDTGGFSVMDLANLERANWKQIVELANKYRGRDRNATEAEEQSLSNALYKAVGIRGGWWNYGLHSFFHLNKVIIKTDDERKLFYSKTADALAEWIASINSNLNLHGKDIDSLTINDLRDANNDVIKHDTSQSHRIRRALTWYIPSHRTLAEKLGWDFMKKLGGVPLSEVPEWLRDDWAKFGDKIQLPLGMLYKWDVPDFPFIDWSSDLSDQPNVLDALQNTVSKELYDLIDTMMTSHGKSTGEAMYYSLLNAASLGLLDDQKSPERDAVNIAVKWALTKINNELQNRLKTKLAGKSEFETEMLLAEASLFNGEEADALLDSDQAASNVVARMSNAMIWALSDETSGSQRSVTVEKLTGFILDHMRDRLHGLMSTDEVRSLLTQQDIDDVLVGTTQAEYNEYLNYMNGLGETIEAIRQKNPEHRDGPDAKNEIWSLKKKVAELFKQIGFSGMRYEAGLLGGGFGHVGSGDFNFVIWDQKVLDSMAMISRNEELMADFRKVYESIQNGTRRGEFDPATGVIMLLKDADSSTLTHELAHWMLESMGKMAMDPNADQSLRDDMNALLSWFGIKDGADGRPALDIWMNSPLSDRREGHERFAISFEDWLLKGIAPTKGLSRLFDQMRYMMIKAYGDVYNPLNEAYKRRFGKDLPAMTPEVKEVYTRLIDADQQMDEAEAAADMLPRFTTKEQWIKNGGDDAGWAEYQKALADARADAKADITQQSQKAMAYLVRAEAAYLRDIQKQYDAEYEKTSVEVEKELRGKTEYKLLDFLSKGVVMDEDGKPIESTRREVHRLDRDKVVAIMTGKTATEIKNWMQELVAAGLDLTNVQRFIRKDGLDPTEVANQFGYQNATQMLSILRDTKPLAEAVANETAARMQKKDGFIDVKNAPMKVVAPLVAKALHNKARMKFVAIEIGALIKSQQPVRILNAAAAQGATNKLREMRLGEVLPNKSKQTARRFRSLTMMHLAKAESEQAAKAAEQELLYTHLHEQQLDFQDFLKKAQERMKSWSRPDKDIVRTRDIDIVNAGRAIMAHFGMYSGDASFSPDKLLSDLERLYPHVYHNLRPLIIKAGLYRQRMEMANRPSKSMPYNLLTVDEFKIVMAQLDGLWDTAKEVRMAEIEGKRMTLDQQEEEIVGQIAANGVPTPPPGTKTWWERNIQSFGVKIGHFTTRLEHYFKFMDNGVVGAFTKYLWRPMNEASQKYQDMMVQYCKRYADLLRKVDLPDGQIIATELQVRDPSNPNGTTPFIFGRGSNQGKAELLKLMLNMGNASNRKYAMKGFKFDPAQFDAFVQRMFKEGVLTDADLDFMQSVFDLTEELGVQANDAFKQMHGYKVDMIPPTEIVNPETGKRIKGGYIPIVADKWVAPRVNLDKDTGEIDLDGFSNVMSDMIPSVQSNFLKERTEREFPPLDLSLSGLAGHIENVVRFVSVAPSLKQVRSLLRRTEVQNALKAHDPDVINRLIKPWLVRTANQSVGNGGAPGYWNGAIWRNLRVGSTALAMATNVAAMLQNVFGLLPAARQVGYTNLLRSAWSIMQAPSDSKKFIFENSKYLSQSARDGMYEVMSYIHSQGKVGKFTKFSNKVHQHLFLLQAITQTPVDMVVWNARYQQVLSELSPSMDYEAAHKEASEQADALVRTTQNANRPVDVAQSETGPDALRLLTSLTGWFTNMVNLNRFEAQRIMRDEVGWRNKSTQYLHLFLSSAVGTVVLGSLVADAYYGKGAFDDDDEEKDALLLAIRSAYGMVKAAAAPLPGVSQLSRGLENLWFDDNIINDKLPVSPGVDMLFNAIRRASNSDEFFSMTNIDTFADLTTLLSGGRIPANWVTDPLNKMLGEKK